MIRRALTVLVAALLAGCAPASAPVGTFPHCAYGVAHGADGPQCSAPERTR